MMPLAVTRYTSVRGRILEAMDATDTTQLLNQFSNGDAEAAGRLIPLVYEDLRQMAEWYMKQERKGHTLQPTALVNEVYLRLFQKKVEYARREHFFAVASQVMRHLLVDYSRRIRAARRQGERHKISLDEIPDPQLPVREDLVRLHEALQDFERLHPRAGRVVEMRFFGGFHIEEIAQALDTSPATVKRDWEFAQAWLHRYLANGNHS